MCVYFPVFSFLENTSPPYGIFYKSTTVTVGKIEKGHKWVDQRHLNVYNLIPIIEQDKKKVNIECVSLLQYMKNELQADAEHNWNTSLEWISDQARLETFELDNDIDYDNTSKQNNDVIDNNEGGTHNMSEEEDRGK
jgi:hypothetical protein